jgi:arylformamidase
MPVWPDSAGFDLTRSSDVAAGAESTVSLIRTDLHCGTHVDAPAHFVPGGAEIADVPLDALVGDAYLAELGDVDRIGRRELDAVGVPPDVERLLLRTRNSALWANPRHPFRRDFVALSEDGASWVVERGIRVVGIDYLSIQLFAGAPEVHRLLLGAGVVVIEGLDLRAAQPGWHTLVCLPLRIVGAEAAPARAILLPPGESRR